MIIYCKRVDFDRYVIYCELCGIPVTTMKGQDLASRLANQIPVYCGKHPSPLSDVEEANLKLKTRQYLQTKWGKAMDHACLLLHISTEPRRREYD